MLLRSVVEAGLKLSIAFPALISFHRAVGSNLVDAEPIHVSSLYTSVKMRIKAYKIACYLPKKAAVSLATIIFL